jgi:hypothetical protein
MRVCDNCLLLSKCQITPGTIGMIQMFGSWLNACTTNRRMTIQKTRFISISVDEVTTVDYQSWLGVHVYFVDRWKCNLVFLTLEQLVNCGTTNNLTKVIVENVLQYGGL